MLAPSIAWLRSLGPAAATGPPDPA